jgi:phosphoenolpyruvate carboxykinase (GTP)
VGELRRDPMAMLPFCGYNMADYWQHWLDMGAKMGANAPKIYQVNWFRKDEKGHFIWPGFGENSRVLEWICRRVDGEAEATDLPAGRVPAQGSLNLEGLDITQSDMSKLFAVDTTMWSVECDLTERFFDQFGARLPKVLTHQLTALRKRLT